VSLDLFMFLSKAVGGKMTPKERVVVNFKVLPQKILQGQRKQ
jgi:hypothetical protein